MRQLQMINDMPIVQRNFGQRYRTIFTQQQVEILEQGRGQEQNAGIVPELAGTLLRDSGNSTKIDARVSFFPV